MYFLFLTRKPRHTFVVATVLYLLVLYPGNGFGQSTTALNNLRVHHLADGSLTVELVTSSSISEPSVKAMPQGAVVDLIGVRPELPSGFLVRNSFDVAIDISYVETGAHPLTRLAFKIPKGTSIVPSNISGRIYLQIGYWSRGVSPGPIAAVPTTAASVSKPKTAEPAVASTVLPKVDATPEHPANRAAVQTPSVTSSIRDDGTAQISGTVKDPNGSVIVGASVRLTSSTGATRTISTDAEGRYRFQRIPASTYQLTVSAPNFEAFTSDNVNVTSRGVSGLDITLNIEAITSTVTVGEATEGLSVDESIGELVLRDRELASLPSDPIGLKMALQGLAAAAGNSMGSEIIVDGFRGSKIPPKSAIKEIRINKNPFSAEFSKPGNNRIEIITKPGYDTFTGGANFVYNGHRFNTRDPFTRETLPYSNSTTGLFLGGPLRKKRSSFFANFERETSGTQSLIRATVLDNLLRPVDTNQTVLLSQSTVNFSPRVDYQIDKNNTLIGRYSYSATSSRNLGVGGNSLASRAYDGRTTEHLVQFTETTVLGPTAVSETRSEYSHRTTQRNSHNGGLALDVAGAFSSGSTFDSADKLYRRLTANNISTFSLKRHLLRGGVGFRFTDITDRSSEGFAGRYRFEAGFGPMLTSSGDVIAGSGMLPISALERYRRTLLLRDLGLSPAEIRARGGGASELSVRRGNDSATASQYTFHAFVQDDWRPRSDLLLAVGLRVEGQSNVRNRVNFAPRASIAWSRSGKQKNKDQTTDMVIRAGFGLFYEPVTEDLLLRTRLYDGIGQNRYQITNPAILDMFPAIPSDSTLAATRGASTVYRFSDELRAPANLHTTLSIEKRLAMKLMLSASYLHLRTFGALRSRLSLATSGQKDFVFESSGRFIQDKLSLTLTRRFARTSFYVTYSLARSLSDTDGADSVITNPADSRSDFGRAAQNPRHSVYIGAWAQVFGDIHLNPLIIYRSGLPFDITLGRDRNGDSVLNDRPAFATDLSRSSVVRTTYGDFDVDPVTGQTIIPRNYGTSPSFFVVNLNMSKTFTLFGESNGSAPRGPIGRPMYVALSVQMENLLNRRNGFLPEGDLSSPLFGQIYTSAGPYGFGNYASGNRRFTPAVTFTF